MVDQTEGRLIGRYEYVHYADPAAAYRPYDERFPLVAQRVVDVIIARMPDAVVEHVGSSAIPGCAGKGVVDLMLLYPPGRLGDARDALDELGFQRFTAPWAFSEERPVRLGTVKHDGVTFRLHVHVLAADAPEVARQRRFRDALRGDPALVAEYVARKRANLVQGVDQADAYNRGKDAVIRRILALPVGDEPAP